MPYKFLETKKIIPRDLNRNVKISIENRQKVRDDYKVLKSQRKTALKWNISRRLVQFILDPEKEQRNKELQKEKGRKYYNKDKHKIYMKTHRHYKQLLFKGNKLIDKEVEE